MNEQMQQFARDFLKTVLAKLPASNCLIFNRMYSPDDLEASVSDVVDDMPEERLDWAMQQVQRSLQKLEAKKAKGEAT